MRRARFKFNLSRHNLGHVSPSMLLREADIAESHLTAAKKALFEEDLALAIDHLFKAAAIAVNVAFTTRTNEIKIPDQIMDRMSAICEEASRTIYRIMKFVAAKKVYKHNLLKHSGHALGEHKTILVKTSKPVEVWFKLTKKGIPLRDLRVLPSGVAVLGHPVADVKEIIGK